MGRPSKLTSEVQQKICDAIKRGNYYDVACEFAGIGRSTFFRWKNAGEKAKSGKYKDFWDAIKKAESEAEVMYVERIREAAEDGQWTAAAWYLERKYPDRWGRNRENKSPDTTEETGEDVDLEAISRAAEEAGNGEEE